MEQNTDRNGIVISRQHITAICLCVAFFFSSTVSSKGFALLGPAQPWMQTTNGVILPGDIGGPMPIGSGYRWNVPVLTYGFDQSFLNFFGTNGVAAVESAIQILNALPPASQIVLSNYPVNSRYFNYQAESYYVCDLKSATLSLLLEHMGLAAPARYVYTIDQWNPILTNEIDGELFLDFFQGTNLANYVVGRNFDPLTLNPSPWVNSEVYNGQTFDLPTGYEIVTLLTDPNTPSENAVSDLPQPYQYICPNPLIGPMYLYPEQLYPGAYFSGLTYDDVGGLSYLLSTNTVNFETLIQNVTGTGTNSNSYINSAWRPGVNKITFIPQPVDSQSGLFLSTTNFFTDSYITNGKLQQQQMQRIISQPDFIFSAGDLHFDDGSVRLYARTGTTNWQNNAAANGNPNGGGPGIIQPPVQIVFQKLGMSFESWGSPQSLTRNDAPSFWGSFDSSTNSPVVYPVQQSGTNQATLRMWLNFGTNAPSSFVWTSSSLQGAPFAFQTSTDLMNWTTLFNLTNDGSVTTYYNDYPTNSTSFFRLIPQ